MEEAGPATLPVTIWPRSTSLSDIRRPASSGNSHFDIEAEVATFGDWSDATRPTVRRRSVAYGVAAIFRASPTRRCHRPAWRRVSNSPAEAAGRRRKRADSVAYRPTSIGTAVYRLGARDGASRRVASNKVGSRSPPLPEGLVKAKSSRRATNTLRNYNDRSSQRGLRRLIVGTHVVSTAISQWCYWIMLLLLLLQLPPDSWMQDQVAEPTEN